MSCSSGDRRRSDIQGLPPGIGIVHQSIWILGEGRAHTGNIYYPRHAGRQDSHNSTMINWPFGMSVWGVVFIEAEGGDARQAVYFLTPEVVGVHMTGALGEADVDRPPLACMSPHQILPARRRGWHFFESLWAVREVLPVAARATSRTSPE